MAMAPAAPFTIVHVDDEDQVHDDTGSYLVSLLKERHPDRVIDYVAVPTHHVLEQLLQGKAVQAKRFNSATGTLKLVQDLILPKEKISFIITDNDTGTKPDLDGKSGAGIEWLESRQTRALEIPRAMYSGNSHELIQTYAQNRQPLPAPMLPKPQSRFDFAPIEELALLIGSHLAPTHVERLGTQVPNRGSGRGGV
ncbi:MAG: hypothetical protein K2Q12_10740 [Rickettsiales bacterium]|nr:hypothetical protein [Rickettsiales bacterium]